MNYKDRCRTCLGSEKEMRHVHSVLSIAGDDVRVSDVLQNFYNFTVIINKNKFFFIVELFIVISKKLCLLDNGRRFAT